MAAMLLSTDASFSSLSMSRLIESWKKSGWEYYFYDDEAAGEFLGTHFPPEVREAYESVVPGKLASGWAFGRGPPDVAC